MYNGYYVYILECADGTYYVGMTNNMDRRLAEHKAGINEEAYTFSRRPVTLVWGEKYRTVREAYQIERKLKKWSAQKKKALIEERFEDLKRLAKCRNHSTHERLNKAVAPEGRSESTPALDCARASGGGRTAGQKRERSAGSVS